jgi:hypothetical protein
MMLLIVVTSDMASKLLLLINLNSKLARTLTSKLVLLVVVTSKVMKSSSEQRSEDVVTECQPLSENPAEIRQASVRAVAVEVDGRGGDADVLVECRRSGSVILIDS